MPNGLGPYWFPDIWRDAITGLSSVFFDEANWDKHDEGYARKQPTRSECDRLMLAACLRDSSQAGTVLAMLACATLSLCFWALVRCCGWISWNFHSKEYTVDLDKRAGQIANMTEAQLLLLNQKCMKDLEAIWLNVADRLLDRAGDNRNGPDARLAARARAIHFALKSEHCTMDAVAAEAGDVPVARSGER